MAARCTAQLEVLLALWNGSHPCINQYPFSNAMDDQKIEVGRDYGTEVEITSGLGGQESLIANPTHNIQEGIRVQAVALKQQQN